ncbi:site-specific integrase, partial [Serratia marcescens]|uniref:site-specific integrase n=1 Tax=Serratia marcescens TaxID=615 RepID=UPI0013DADE5C
AYAKASQPPNTARAYRSDWGHYLDWCQSVELSSEPADPEVVGLYLTAMANGTIDGASLSVSTIDRRLSALSWTFRQLGQILDRKDPH